MDFADSFDFEGAIGGSDFPLLTVFVRVEQVEPFRGRAILAAVPKMHLFLGGKGYFGVPFQVFVQPCGSRLLCAYSEKVGTRGAIGRGRRAASRLAALDR